MRIVLIGFKNCGKTSVGKLLAHLTNTVFIDTDDLITQQYEAQAKKSLKSSSISDIYQDKGEQYFRTLEKQVINSLQSQQHIVIATGGGSILDEENVSHLKKQGQLIYLYASLKTLLARLKSQTVPAFLDAKQPEVHFTTLYRKRAPLYQQAADIEISTEEKSLMTVAKEIITLKRGVHNG